MKIQQGKVYKWGVREYFMNYTIKDKRYFEVLKKVTEEFERENIDYALVGGAGIQARLANILSKNGKIDMQNLVEIDSLLRKTQDFDVTSTSSEEDFVSFFNHLQAINPNLSVFHEALRSKRIHINGRKSTDVFLNYQTGPTDFAGLDDNFYNECINTADFLNLHSGNSPLGVYVAKPEYLIAPKLTRMDPKDIFDITILLKSMQKYGRYNQISLCNNVKALLDRAKKGEVFGRLEEIIGQNLKE